MSRDTAVKDDTYSAIEAMVLREGRSGWHVYYVLCLEFESKASMMGWCLHIDHGERDSVS